MICLYVKNNTVPVYELFIFLRELLKKTLINECYIPFQIYYDPNVTSDVLLEKVSTACHHLSSVSSLRMTFSSNKTTPSLTVRFEAWVAHVSFYLLCSFCQTPGVQNWVDHMLQVMAYWHQYWMQCLLFFIRFPFIHLQCLHMCRNSYSGVYYIWPSNPVSILCFR